MNERREREENDAGKKKGDLQTKKTETNKKKSFSSLAQRRTARRDLRLEGRLPPRRGPGCGPQGGEPLDDVGDADGRRGGRRRRRRGGRRRSGRRGGSGSSSAAVVVVVSAAPDPLSSALPPLHPLPHQTVSSSSSSSSASSSSSKEAPLRPPQRLPGPRGLVPRRPRRLLGPRPRRRLAQQPALQRLALGHKLRGRGVDSLQRPPAVHALWGLEGALERRGPAALGEELAGERQDLAP